MRVVVTASRHATLDDGIRNKLDHFAAMTGDKMSALAHGDARGGDQEASMWWFGYSGGIPAAKYPYHREHGKAGGPIRNGVMLADFEPDIVIAFPCPKSKGTWDCIRQAVAKGIEVHIFPIRVG